ncbi:MAG: hypothetical protein OSA48_11900 [Akkermansiaceae bacterium]|nr:hypothetical protein [Akkermansiaceae bacterium]
MKLLAPLLLTIALASCTSFAPTYPPPRQQAEVPPPSGPSATQQVYSTAQQAAGAINTARTLGSVF